MFIKTRTVNELMFYILQIHMSVFVYDFIYILEIILKHFLKVRRVGCSRKYDFNFFWTFESSTHNVTYYIL